LSAVRSACVRCLISPGFLLSCAPCVVVVSCANISASAASQTHQTYPQHQLRLRDPVPRVVDGFYGRGRVAFSPKCVGFAYPACSVKPLTTSARRANRPYSSPPRALALLLGPLYWLDAVKSARCALRGFPKRCRPGLCVVVAVCDVALGRLSNILGCANARLSCSSGCPGRRRTPWDWIRPPLAP
jgi:hypothetical protein